MTPTIHSVMLDETSSNIILYVMLDDVIWSSCRAVADADPIPRIRQAPLVLRHDPRAVIEDLRLALGFPRITETLASIVLALITEAMGRGRAVS